MRHLSHFMSVLCILFVALGCEPQFDLKDGPFGPPKNSPLLAPFSGKWTCDFEKTLDAFRAAGVPEESINRSRKFHEENPQFGNIHPDLEITGDLAVCGSLLSSEYRFFAMHEHDGKICGKAWHHEDRYDPCDMSKCYIRLKLNGNDLQMDVKMQGRGPDLNDPDFNEQPPEGGSAQECDAENPPGEDWDKWITYIFTRTK